jgi:hypothetical protein
MAIQYACSIHAISSYNSKISKRGLNYVQDQLLYRHSQAEHCIPLSSEYLFASAQDNLHSRKQNTNGAEEDGECSVGVDIASYGGSWRRTRGVGDCIAQHGRE